MRKPAAAKFVCLTYCGEKKETPETPDDSGAIRCPMIRRFLSLLYAIVKGFCEEWLNGRASSCRCVI